MDFVNNNKKCKKLGLDLDNTVTELDFTLVEMAKFYGKEIPSVDDITDFNLSEIFNISWGESRDFWESHEHYLIENAVVAETRLSKMLEMFADKETEIYIITNRPKQHYDITKEWLNRCCISHKELHVVQGSKAELIGELELDVMIDDKPDLFYEALEVKDNYEKYPLMAIVDYEYNKLIPCDVRIDRNGDVISG